jgi:hypothetical protein
MWTDTTRAQYARADLAWPIDLTDSEGVVRIVNMSGIWVIVVQPAAIRTE